MSWQSLQTQFEKFSQIIKNESVNIEEFTEHPKNLLSLSKKISPLKMIGTRSKFYVEAPTSGESSPCLSESGKTPRFNAPSVLDIKGQINHEEIIEVDYDIEKISNSNEKYPTLFIEGLDEFITIDDFDSILEGVRILTYEKNDIFVTKKSKFLNYKEKKCLALKTLIKQPKLFARFIRKFQMHFKNMLGYGVSVSFAKMHRKISSVVNGVVLRNIPPKITHEELKGQCSEGIDGKISVGQIQRIKDVNCCLVECDYLEDAEVICKKINKTRVRDAETKESFVIKVN